jgi:signal transduction histidine kinase
VLFEETIRFIKGQVPATVAIAVNVPEDLEIVADKQRIQQAFLNLLKNAAESIAEEGTVTVSARKHPAIDKAGDETSIVNYLRYHGKCTLEDDTVDIEIRDTGIGIPPEIIQKVFDPFFTTKDVGKGSGLGLFIVHEIIEEHDRRGQRTRQGDGVPDPPAGEVEERSGGAGQGGQVERTDSNHGQPQVKA